MLGLFLLTKYSFFNAFPLFSFRFRSIKMSSNRHIICSFSLMVLTTTLSAISTKFYGFFLQIRRYGPLRFPFLLHFVFFA